MIFPQKGIKGILQIDFNNGDLFFVIPKKDLFDYR